MSTLQETQGTRAATNAEALAAAMVRHGCTHVFGLMGDGNMRLFTALDRAGVELAEVRHESAAVAMAEGYSWSSGRVGICSVTHGPGLTHVATSLVVAARNRSKLVLIAAETPVGYAGAQHFDQQAFVAACETPYRRMLEGEDAAAVFEEAVALAEQRSGPVVLAVPADLLEATATTGPKRPGVARRTTPADGDPETAARLLGEALAEADRPVIVAGRGAMNGSAVTLAAKVAEHFGAALSTTLPAKGLFDGHPLDLGICGGLAHPAAERLLREADLVLAIGASMGRSTTQSTRLFEGAKIVRLSHDPNARPLPHGLIPVVGDAERTLTRLVHELDRHGPARKPWFELVGPSDRCWAEDLADYAPPIPAGSVDPRRAVAEISRLIPEDAILVVSNGHCSGFASAFSAVPRKGAFFTAQGFGSIGQALTSAVGVALGAPDRKVVVFEGDAGFMMHAQELDTAVRAGANITVFILNDRALGTEYQRLLASGGTRGQAYAETAAEAEAALAVVPPPDLAPLARAFGARGATIDDDAETQTVAQDALRPGLAVVDVRTARTVLSRHMRLPSSARQAKMDGAR